MEDNIETLKILSWLSLIVCFFMPAAIPIFIIISLFTLWAIHTHKKTNENSQRYSERYAEMLNREKEAARIKFEQGEKARAWLLKNQEREERRERIRQLPPLERFKRFWMAKQNFEN